MYIPAHFAESGTSEIHRIIERFPLATLVTTGQRGLDANQIPFELALADGEPVLLRAHIARANPVWQETAEGSAALVIFRAEDAYVSPNWYPSKHLTHRHVPTWNYQVVNVHGTVRFVQDEKYLRALVGRLTRKHEMNIPGNNPWRMADAPAEYIDSMLKAIVGIEIEINRVEAKSKLSQNREERDRLAAADALDNHGHTRLADAMRNR